MIELPPELITQWLAAAINALAKMGHAQPETIVAQVAAKAAQWAADQELEACCQWLETHNWPMPLPDHLYTARRPKPPSLKEQALLQLDTLNADLAMHGRGCDLSQIRRALSPCPMTSPELAAAMVAAYQKEWREHIGPLEDPESTCLAAALRVMVDHVVPDEPKPPVRRIPDTGWWGKHDLIRSELLALVDALEAL